MDLAKHMIDKFVKNTAREVSIDYIQKVVCDYFDLPIELLVALLARLPAKVLAASATP